MGTRTRFGIASGVGLLAIGLVGALPVGADVQPSSFSAELSPGESTTVTKTVTVPIPSKLDIVLDVDLSGSYGDDIVNIKDKAPEIFDRIRAEAPESQFGLVTFVDFPFSPWGGGPDYGYRRDQTLTSDRDTWLAAVNAMSILGGGDTPESQYESLFQAVTGQGREMPPTTNGSFSDPGEIPPGLEAGFRPDAARVIAITTDAPFHVEGDPGSSFSYPGPSRDAVINALQASNVKVIALKAPGSDVEMDDLATATGGAVVTTDQSSTEISDAIITGLRTIQGTVTAQPVGCGGLSLSFAPPQHPNVQAGAVVQFEETITLDAGAGPGVINCVVQYKFGDAVIGEQAVEIRPRVGKGKCTNVIRGSKKSEKLNGTSDSDRIGGKRGKDRIKGRGGDDCLRGGADDDKVAGGAGDDEIRGGRGANKIKAGSGKDVIRVRRGRRDRVNCGSGNDKVFINPRKDTVHKNCEKVVEGRR